MEFILYACPQGQLAKQIDSYSSRVLETCVPNSAHNYMPHCTLTGFFDDDVESIPSYLDSLDLLYQKYLPKFKAQPSIHVVGLEFRSDWHGLLLEASELKQLAWEFAEQTKSTTRTSPIRPKDWLHLSLAYDFQPEEAIALQHLAEKMVIPESTVHWELRFYQRDFDHQWTCHRSWDLP